MMIDEIMETLGTIVSTAIITFIIYYQVTNRNTDHLNRKLEIEKQITNLHSYYDKEFEKLRTMNRRMHEWFEFQKNPYIYSSFVSNVELENTNTTIPILIELVAIDDILKLYQHIEYSGNTNDKYHDYYIVCQPLYSQRSEDPQPKPTIKSIIIRTSSDVSSVPVQIPDEICDDAYILHLNYAKAFEIVWNIKYNNALHIIKDEDEAEKYNLQYIYSGVW